MNHFFEINYKLGNDSLISVNDSNNMLNEIPVPNDLDFHHKDYIFILLILLFGFFAWAFYLFNFVSNKRKIENLIKQREEVLANNVKLENLRYLSLANLSN